jgi:hypothetical protein
MVQNGARIRVLPYPNRRPVARLQIWRSTVLRYQRPSFFAFFSR